MEISEKPCECIGAAVIGAAVIGAAVIGNSCCGFPANECISMMAKQINK